LDADDAAAGLAVAQEPTAATALAPVQVPAPEKSGPGHVLVVDDGELALRFISTQLKRYGFQVHVAREPREALAQLQARRYEFVFIEINLEADCNFPVTQAIRQTPLGAGEKAPAVVLLADRHSGSELQTAANAGADAWLTTPLLEADLLKLIGPRSPPRAKPADAELRSATSA
jgi:CheY-like chemotaxis protein